MCSWWGKLFLRRYVGLPLALYLADLGTRLVCPKTLARSVILSFSLSLQWGRKHWGKLPYHLQHRYFFLGKTSTPHHRPSVTSAITEHTFNLSKLASCHHYGNS